MFFRKKNKLNKKKYLYNVKIILLQLIKYYKKNKKIKYKFI